jgi:hypothetical protein
MQHFSSSFSAETSLESEVANRKATQIPSASSIF